MIAIAAIVIALLLGSVLLLSERRLKAQGYKRSRRRPLQPDVSHVFNLGQSTSIRGGARVGWSNASVPLARLVIDENWAHIRAPLLRDVWIHRPNVSAVRRIRGLMGPGLQFVSRTGEYDGVIFWTFAPDAVLSSFRRFGWATESGRA